MVPVNQRTFNRCFLRHSLVFGRLTAIKRGPSLKSNWLLVFLTTVLTSCQVIRIFVKSIDTYYQSEKNHENDDSRRI